MTQETNEPPAQKPSHKIYLVVKSIELLFLAVVILSLCDFFGGGISGNYPFVHQLIMEKESEGMQTVGAFNRCQQDYFLKKGKLATSVAQLGMGVQIDTVNYHYEMLPQTDPKQAVFIGLSKVDHVNSFGFFRAFGEAIEIRNGR